MALAGVCCVLAVARMIEEEGAYLYRLEMEVGGSRSQGMGLKKSGVSPKWATGSIFQLLQIVVAPSDKFQVILISGADLHWSKQDTRSLRVLVSFLFGLSECSGFSLPAPFLCTDLGCYQTGKHNSVEWIH